MLLPCLTPAPGAGSSEQPGQRIQDHSVTLPSPFREGSRCGTRQDPCGPGPQDSSGARARAGSAHLQGSAARLCGSHCQGDVEGPLLLLQDGDDECTHLMALLGTEGGNPCKALRIPGHGEHSVNVSSFSIHKTRPLRTLHKLPTAPHLRFPSQPRPETGPSMPALTGTHSKYPDLAPPQQDATASFPSSPGTAKPHQVYA